MLHVIRAKFSDPELQDMLLATGQQELEEGNWWGDDFWGKCTKNGQNKLGIILMLVRDELQ